MLTWLGKEILDALAFQALGWPGPIGRWASSRVIAVWCRTPVEEPWC